MVFSFVGMKTQEVALKNQKEINIVMEEDAKVMDEVVVTGIFERKKERFCFRKEKQILRKKG